MVHFRFGLYADTQLYLGFRVSAPRRHLASDTADGEVHRRHSEVDAGWTNSWLMTNGQNSSSWCHLCQEGKVLGSRHSDQWLNYSTCSPWRLVVWMRSSTNTWMCWGNKSTSCAAMHVSSRGIMVWPSDPGRSHPAGNWNAYPCTCNLPHRL